MDILFDATKPEIKKDNPVYLVGICGNEKSEILKWAKEFAAKNNLIFFTHQEVRSGL
ncbi:MAG: hypothetical protein H0U57_02890 [Tatlockia sp.]|nr:hypothetical protein [Tatlockia sp.]